MMKGTFGRLLRGGSASDDNSPLDFSTPPGRLAGFFREIDNTTTPRRLTLAIGDAEMTFDLANKKVLKVIDLTPDEDGRGKIACDIVRDYDQLDSQLKLLAELITSFISRAGDFDVVSRPLTANYPPKMDGFPSAEVRFACDLYGVLPATVVAEVPRVAEPAAPAPEPVAVVTPAPAIAAPPVVAAPAAAPIVQTPAPAPREHAMAAAATSAAPGLADADTISSIITALGSGPGAAADVIEAAPKNDRATVENFYDAVSRHCDLSMLVTDQGDIVQFTDSAAGWFDIGPDIAKDMKNWVRETSKIMPGCQLVVMRSPILNNQSVIFMTSGKLTAFGAFSSHVTGRIFSIANEYVGQRR
jgi:hypothetical protein